MIVRPHQEALAMNALHPDRMTSTERLAEIGELLGAAFIRLQARKSRPLSDDCGESSLDFTLDQRGHAGVLTDGEST
jgi:hypothetical protein